MAKFDYPISSPYAVTPQLSWRLGRYNHRPVLPHESDEQIIVEPKYANRPDKLSRDKYGTAAYWWVFMLRNMDQIRDPIFDLNAGMRIWIPSPERVSSLSK